MKNAVVGLGLAVLLAVGGCSRQQSDWEKTRASNTTDSYEQFLKKYPSGEFTAQAQARVKELYEERDWQKARDADTLEAYQAFLKQYPEGKWTDEARIRVENFSLAQAPSNGTPAAPDAANAPGLPATAGAAAVPPTVMPPAAAPVPPPSPPPSAAPKGAPSQTGSYGIQLGAFKTGADAANRRWEHLDKEYPKLLAGLSPTVAPRKTTAGTLYRLQVTGLSEKRARAICNSLKAKSQACVVIAPGHH